MAENPAASKFQVAVNRQLLVLGDSRFFDHISLAVKKLEFINPVKREDFSVPKDQIFFVIHEADFKNSASISEMAQALSLIDMPNASKIIYVSYPARLERDQMLLCHELGAEYVASGVMKERELVDFMKRVTQESEKEGSLSYFRKELEKAIDQKNTKEVEKIIERVLKLGKNNEKVLSVAFEGSAYIKNWRKAEFYLKSILEINPQNLWAANHLGRYYLRENKISQGVEVLERLSRFHELNMERLVQLGQTYLDCDQEEQADDIFSKGFDFTGGQDDRFREGKAKVKFLKGNYDAAIELLEEKGLSLDVLSFLNTRAVVAARNQQYEKSIELYEQAIDGSRLNDIITAKLYFNLSLSKIRSGKLDSAIESLKNSLKYGGAEFQRAEKLIPIVQRALISHVEVHVEDEANNFAYENDLDDQLDEALEERIATAEAMSWQFKL